MQLDAQITCRDPPDTCFVSLQLLPRSHHIEEPALLWINSKLKNDQIKL